MRASSRAVAIVVLAIVAVVPACSDDEVTPLCAAVEETRAAFQDLKDPATLEGGREDVSAAADELATSLAELRQQAGDDLDEGLDNLEDEIDELEQVAADTTLSDLSEGEVDDQVEAVENAWSAMGDEARAALGDC